MSGDALGRKIVALSATAALIAGCSRSAAAVRDASAVRAQADGVAEAQASGTAAPPTIDAAAPPAGAGDAAASPTARPAPTRPATDGGEGGRDPHRMRRVLGWVSVSIGAEAAVVAVATSFLIEHQKGVRDRDCNAQKVCSAEGFDAAGTISTIVPWNAASWFVAAAGLGAGAVLLILSASASKPTTAITLSPGPSGLGLAVRSAF